MRCDVFPNEFLMDVIKRAAKTPFYRDRFAGEIAGWEQIPLTSKDDLREAYPLGLLGVPKSRIATYHESSGTTGRPVSSYFTENDWTDIQSRFLRSRVGLGDGDMVLVKTPYSLVTTALQMHGAARSAGAAVIAADNRSRNMPYARVIRLLHELPVTVTWSLPTEILIWAHLIRRFGLDPARDFPNLRALVVAGESLSAGKKAALSRIWGGKPVIEDYGSTETGSLAGECEQGRLHVWSDRIFFETCDDAGRPTAGEGSLIVTPLFREAMPLVRYNMEDHVRLSRAPLCACGSAHPTIDVLGRRNQRIRGDVFPKQIEDCVYAIDGELLFWRARICGTELEVEISGSDISSRELEEDLKRKLDISARVRIVRSEAFVPETWLADEPVMQKPRFVFAENENWSDAVSYS